jgi:hypothetical protein
VLGALTASLSLQGQGIELQAWEAPWRRAPRTPSGVRALELPAPAGLACSGGTGRRLDVLLLPDLGWTPVGLHSRTLASLVALRATWRAEAVPTLVVATGAAPKRVHAWRELSARGHRAG